MNTPIKVFFSCLMLFVISCSESNKEMLPIMGRQTFKEVDGKVDTIFHTIPNFQLVDQDSAIITEEVVEGKIYVADFFFGTCPTICPIMKQQMLRVYERFKDQPNFVILSHTIDPDHDTVAYLNEYAKRLGVEDNKVWHFLTGNKEHIYDLGSPEGYMVPVGEDEDAPGGYIHSGAFILLDKDRRVRGFYDGTKAEEVDKLMQDIPKLFAAYGEE